VARSHQICDLVTKTLVESKMRSSIGRLAGRGALLAALGFGGFGAVYGAAAEPADVVQAADWNWLTVDVDGPKIIDEPPVDETPGVPASEAPTVTTEGWEWV
jgi:hypothetical protein